MIFREILNLFIILYNTNRVFHDKIKEITSFEQFLIYSMSLIRNTSSGDFFPWSDKRETEGFVEKAHFNFELSLILIGVF